jgi:hypothetical protein
MVLLFIIVSCSKNEQKANFTSETENNAEIEIENFIEIEKENIIFGSKEKKSKLIILKNNEDQTSQFILENESGLSKQFVWDLLVKHSDSWESEGRDFLNRMGPNYLGDSLDFLSKINVDIDPSEGETWFSSWFVQDSAPITYNWLYMHIINENTIKTYKIQLSATSKYSDGFLSNNYKTVQFPVLYNLPGQFNQMAWLYDINDDGFDEIICLYDTLVSVNDFPQMHIYIAGYDKDIDGFVFYLDLEVITTDAESGPEPVQYIHDQNNRGLLCSIYDSNYESLAIKNDNLKWCFISWDKEIGKFIESEIISE